MSTQPTLGRYAEIPVQEITRAQQDGYERVVKEQRAGAGPVQDLHPEPGFVMTSEARPSLLAPHGNRQPRAC
jgi:hypothetical protein